jgi:hypothetical protein
LVWISYDKRAKALVRKKELIHGGVRRPGVLVLINENYRESLRQESSYVGPCDCFTQEIQGDHMDVRVRQAACAPEALVLSHDCPIPILSTKVFGLVN